LLEPRRSVEKALTAVIHHAYANGGSTHSMDDLVKAMGGTGMSRTQSSGSWSCCARQYLANIEMTVVNARAVDGYRVGLIRRGGPVEQGVGPPAASSLSEKLTTKGRPTPPASDTASVSGDPLQWRMHHDPLAAVHDSAASHNFDDRLDTLHR
jgi:hypothetical protein